MEDNTEDKQQLRTIISDYKNRSEAIEKSIGATVRRIKLLEATVPALMIWRKWRNEGRVPQLDIDELINKQIELRKQIKAAQSEEKQKFFEEFKVAKSETSMDTLNNKIDAIRRLQRYIVQEKMIKQKINELEEKQQTYMSALEQIVNPQQKLPCADPRKRIPFPIKQISPEPCYCDPCECDSCKLIPPPDLESEEPQEVGLITGPSLNSVHDMEMMTEEVEEEEEEEDEGGEGDEKDEEEPAAEPPAEEEEEEKPPEETVEETEEGAEDGGGGGGDEETEEPPPPPEPEETDWSAIIEETPKLNFKEAATKLTSVFETLKTEYRSVDCQLLGTLRDLSKFISVTAELVPQDVIEQALKRGEEEQVAEEPVEPEEDKEEHVCAAVKYKEGLGVVIEDDESTKVEEVEEADESETVEEVEEDESEVVEEEEEPTGKCTCGVDECPMHGDHGAGIQKEPSLLSNFDALFEDLQTQKCQFPDKDVQCQCKVECECAKCTNTVPIPDIDITDRQRQLYEPCDDCDCDTCVCNIVCQANVLTNLAKSIPCSNSRELPPPPEELESLNEASVQGSITTEESDVTQFESEELPPEESEELPPEELPPEEVEEEIIDDKPWKHKTDDQLTAEDLEAMACTCEECNCKTCPDSKKSPGASGDASRGGSAEEETLIEEQSLTQEGISLGETIAEESKAPSEAGGEPTGAELDVSIAESSKGEDDEASKAPTEEAGEIDVSVDEKSFAPTEEGPDIDLSIEEKSEITEEGAGEGAGGEAGEGAGEGAGVEGEGDQGMSVSEKPSLISNFEELHHNLMKLKNTIPVEGEVECKCTPCECSPCLGHVAAPDIDITDRQRQIYEPCDICDCGDIGGPCMCNIICQYNVLNKLAEEIPCINYDQFYGEGGSDYSRSLGPCTCGEIGSCHCMCKICPCSQCNMLMEKCADICGDMAPSGPQPCDCGLPCICTFCPDNKCQCDPCVKCPDCPDKSKAIGAEDLNISEAGGVSPGTSSMEKDIGSDCTCLAPIEESVKEIFKNKACKCANESQGTIDDNATNDPERTRSGAEQSKGGVRCTCLKRVEQNIKTMFKNEACQCPDPLIKESEYAMGKRRDSNGGGVARENSGVRFSDQPGGSEGQRRSKDDGPSVCICEPTPDALKDSKLKIEIDEVMEKHKRAKPSVIVVVGPNRYFTECSSHILSGTRPCALPCQPPGQNDAACQPCDSAYMVAVDMGIDCSNAQKEPVSVETEQRINMHCKNTNCPCCKPCRCNCKRSCLRED